MTEMEKPPSDQGAISFGKRIGEGTSMAIDRLAQVAVHDRLQVTRADVVRALAKLDEGTYGACDVVRGAHPEGRLEALPWAVLCVAGRGQALTRGVTAAQHRACPPETPCWLRGRASSTALGSPRASACRLCPPCRPCPPRPSRPPTSGAARRRGRRRPELGVRRRGRGGRGGTTTTHRSTARAATGPGPDPRTLRARPSRPGLVGQAAQPPDRTGRDRRLGIGGHPRHHLARGRARGPGQGPAGVLRDLRRAREGGAPRRGRRGRDGRARRSRAARRDRADRRTRCGAG